MNSLNSAIKKTAKSLLKNEYFGCIVAASMFIIMLLACNITVSLLGMFLGEAVSLAVLGLLIIFLLTPLTIGFAYWNVHFVFSSENEPLLIFNCFSSKKKYKRALLFSLPLAGIALFSGLIIFVPCIIADLIASGKLFVLFNVPIPLWAPSIWAVANAMWIAAYIVFALVMLRYYLAPFLMAADEKMEPMEALHMSKIISKRSRSDFLMLMLGLIVYIIACLFLLPTIFILPYIATAYTLHCRYSVAAYNNSIDNMLNDDIPSFDADISF